MGLTYREQEAFYRGKAAGIIPADCPMPVGREIDQMILYIGPMYSRTVGCRNQAGKLFFVEVSVFSQKYLEETIKHLPDLMAEVSEVTELQIEKYDVSLNVLANYFSLGRDIIDEEDIASRFPPLTADDIRKGFDFKYEPVKIADYASDEQRMALSERIIQGKNRGMTCREWENLTGTKAAELLQNSDLPQETISERVRLLADEYLKLTQEERILFFETIKQRTKA
ncbi:MAG: hypothetical protein J5858_07415 [Lentisphaeria bacterium]|nr:hypothetical protein [Lentisphaeria bacterium]